MWSKRIVPVLLLLAGCSDPPMDRLPNSSEAELADVGALTVPVAFAPEAYKGEAPPEWKDVPVGIEVLVATDREPGKGGGRMVRIAIADETSHVRRAEVARRHLRPVGRSKR